MRDEHRHLRIQSSIAQPATMARSKFRVAVLKGDGLVHIMSFLALSAAGAHAMAQAIGTVVKVVAQ